MSDFPAISSATKSRFESLLQEDEAFWRETIKPFLREDNLGVLIGKPSKRKMSDLEKADEKFIADRKTALGKERMCTMVENEKKKNR